MDKIKWDKPPLIVNGKICTFVFNKLTSYSGDFPPLNMKGKINFTT